MGECFMFDYHIHSDFSADCSTPMEKTIEKAIEDGLKEICFTDHIDYDYPDPTITFDLDLPAYEPKITDMQSLYSDRLTIKKGVEIGVQPHLLEKYTTLLEKETFDFIICSMHTTDRKDLHSGSLFDNRTTEEAFAKYYEELLFCVENYEAYTILGHLDLVKRYTDEIVEHDFHDLIQQIFKEIIPKGNGIEVNTSSYRYGMTSGMPSVDILKLYKELGGEIITLGSDSHTETTLAYQFEQTLATLDELGFKYIATFNQQEPTFHPIKSLQKFFADR